LLLHALHAYDDIIEQSIKKNTAKDDAHAEKEVSHAVHAYPNLPIADFQRKILNVEEEPKVTGKERQEMSQP